MVVKAEVTPEEKERIKELAKEAGMSVSSYIKHKALGWVDPNEAIAPLMRYIEIESKIAQQINTVATTVIENKVVYEKDILYMLKRVENLEKLNADFLKGVIKHGNSG